MCGWFRQTRPNHCSLEINALKRTLQNGQAMAEMLMALIAIVVILVGIVQFGEIGFHHISALNDSIRLCSGAAMFSDSGSEEFYQNAAFGTARTVLSTPMNYTVPLPYNLCNQFTSGSSKNWLHSPPLNHYVPVGKIDRASQGYAQAEPDTVDFGDAFKNLIYNADKLNLVDTDVYLPVLSNLQQ